MSLHVLLVDDDELVRRSIARALKLRRYTVTAAAGAREALGALLESEVDVVLSDIWMPEMDGLQLLEQVQEHWPDLPVVLFTGLPLSDIQARAHRLGAVAVLSKPLAPEPLDEVLRGAIEQA